jgi:hypothetical protein
MSINLMDFDDIPGPPRSLKTAQTTILKPRPAASKCAPTGSLLLPIERRPNFLLSPLCPAADRQSKDRLK